MIPGIGGFASRPPQDDDPLVCACGMTIGTRSGDRLAEVMDKHNEEHKRRLAHQARHKNQAGPCD